MCAIFTRRCVKTKEHKQFYPSKSDVMKFPALLIRAVHLSTVYNAASPCENKGRIIQSFCPRIFAKKITVYLKLYSFCTVFA